MSSNHDRHGQHRYGTHHQKLRKRWALEVRAGKAACWRCGKPIAPDERWDLGHDDENPSKHRGPEHRRCNRATLPRMLAKARGEAVAADPLHVVEEHDCRVEFDPRRCPECRRRDPTPGNSATRWSGHWDAWGVYNPRCKHCRRSGVACEAAVPARGAA